MSAPASDQVTFIDELSSTRRKRRIVEGESGGGNNDQPVAIADERNVMLSVVIQSPASPRPQPHPSNEWLNSIMNEGDESSKSMPKNKIQKVPKMLRQMETDSTKNCYVPLLVSIGPYHHHNTELKSFEKFKIRFTREYVKSCRSFSITELYDKVAEVAGEARKCYSEGSTEDFDDTDFTQMMFLDGCFILQFIIYCTKSEEKGIKLKMKNHNKAFVQRDLFLLENQLPLKVLQALMSMNSNFDGDQGLTLIKKFIENTRASPPPQDSFSETVEHFITELITNRKGRHDKAEAGSDSGSEDEPAHLLELMHRQLIYPKAFRIPSENQGEGGSIRYSPLMIRLISFLNVFRFFKKPKGSNYSTSWYSYHSVQELMAAGIKFRPNNKKTNFLNTDVRYEPLIVRAILRLPPMIIDDSSQAILLNLVAYEMCPDSPNDFGVTSYIWLMDTLIDHAEDVKELRKKGIILNYLGSDEEVAQLFNEIAKNLVPNPLAYEEVRNQIERHYKYRVLLWTIGWLKTHFSAPWTRLTILAFFLTAVQTYFAIRPNNNSGGGSANCEH